MAVGTVGGTLQVHPGARLALRILRVSTSEELGMVIGAAGPGQNLAALRALAPRHSARSYDPAQARGGAMERPTATDRTRDPYNFAQRTFALGRQVARPRRRAQRGAAVVVPAPWSLDGGVRLPVLREFARVHHENFPVALRASYRCPVIRSTLKIGTDSEFGDG